MRSDIVLSEFSEDEQPILDAWFDHPSIAKWFDWWRGQGREVGTGNGDGTRVARPSLRWIVRETSTGDPLGFVSADVTGPEVPGTRETTGPYTAGLVYLVAPDRQGQGIGPAILTAAMTRPEFSDIAEFRCAVEEKNRNSMVVVERLGFTLCGSAVHGGKPTRYYRKDGPAA